MLSFITEILFSPTTSVRIDKWQGC